jgi:glycosyltransferase involved in cell wall biosynthesis
MSVINDLVTDQRVDKVSRTLQRMGFEVLLVGRRKHDSLSLTPRSYATHRMRLLFERGPFFYMEFNIRLFFYLLQHPADVLVANDLDTLLPNYLVHKIRRIPIVYDSHEYFTGVPELEGRPMVRKVWKSIERFIFPKLENIFTVNDSIAELYGKEYHKKLRVVRNVPEKTTMPARDRAALGLPGDKAILLMQGAGINIQRGAEEAVLAMRYLDNCLLLIIGDGDALPALKTMVAEYKLEQKVTFIPKQAFPSLMKYTVCADIGLTLDKDTNLNYRFSLPNKIFDYIRAGIPVLSSDLPEIRKVIEAYDIGRISPSHDPETLAKVVEDMLRDPERIAIWKENLIIAAEKLCWENEEHSLHDVYGRYC